MKVSFIGSGNVAYSLATAFYNNGVEVLTVVSRKKENANYLAHKVGAIGTNMIKDIDPSTELVFLCVPDDEILKVSESIKLSGVIQVHTSGSVPLEALKTEDRGVLYPLQSLTKGVEIDLLQVPILLEANSVKTEVAIDKLSSGISNIVRFKNSVERRNLHMAAVFANNFTNHLLGISQELCDENKLDFEFLKPLVIQTVAKVFSVGANEAQTGPALRGDTRTLEIHKEMLSSKPDYLEVYKSISNSIIENSRKK